MKRIKRRPRTRCDADGIALHGWEKFGNWHFTRDPATIDHTHAWWIANQLRTEEGYDFTPYSDDFRFKYSVWLWYESGELVAGLFFRHWLPDDKHPDVGHELCWVWVVPNARRQGILSSVWPKLREMYGDFWVQGPLSDGMRSFLRRPGFHAKNFGRDV